MKKNFSRGLLPVIFLCLSLGSLLAQDSNRQTKVFVRLYNLEGKKIARGRIVQATDTKITLQRGKKTIEEDIGNIGFLRTKHSVGNNMLIGAATGSAIAAVAFASEADPDAWIFGYSAAEGVLAGFIVGTPVGGAIGALTALFKKSQQFEINGEQERWLKIRDALLQKGENS